MKIYISWADQYPIEYEFSSEDQQVGFIKGVCEAGGIGEMEFEIFYSMEEWREKYSGTLNKDYDERYRL